VHTTAHLRLHARKRSAIPGFSGRHGTGRDAHFGADPVKEMNVMKQLVLAAFAALGLVVGVAPLAHAYTTGFVHNTYHSGPYDDTGHGPGETGLEGGGG
jgi:hypothetical protein